MGIQELGGERTSGKERSRCQNVSIPLSFQKQMSFALGKRTGSTEMGIMVQKGDQGRGLNASTRSRA